MANTHGSELWQPGFIAVFLLSSAIAFVLPFLVRLRGKLPLADTALDGLNAAYPNTGYMGIPLSMIAFGSGVLAATTISIIITVCVTFAFAIVLIEIGLQTEKKPLRLIWKVIRSLIRNPLLVAPALGAVVSFLGLAIPAPAETFLKMLGGAASPCALVALGLFLAQPRRIERESVNAIAFLVSVKLIVQPLATWLLAVYVFGLPPSSHKALPFLQHFRPAQVLHAGRALSSRGGHNLQRHPLLDSDIYPHLVGIFGANSLKAQKHRQKPVATTAKTVPNVAVRCLFHEM